MSTTSPLWPGHPAFLFSFFFLVSLIPDFSWHPLVWFCISVLYYRLIHCQYPTGNAAVHYVWIADHATLRYVVSLCHDVSYQFSQQNFVMPYRHKHVCLICFTFAISHQSCNSIIFVLWLSAVIISFIKCLSNVSMHHNCTCILAVVHQHRS